MEYEIQIARNGAIIGTYTLETLRMAIARGDVVPADYAWHEGMPDWLPLAEFRSLQLEPETATSRTKKKQAEPKESKAQARDWKQDPATMKQIAYLESFGVTAKADLTKGEASELLGKLTDDPAALARQQAIRETKWEKQEGDSAKNQSYCLREDVESALKALAEAENEFGENDDPESAEFLRENLKDAKEAVKESRQNRLTFWKDTFREDNDDMDLSAMQYYEEWGRYFKVPTNKQITDILNALDAASHDWDETEPHLFYATLEENFPDSVRKGSASGTTPGKAKDSGCLVLLVIVTAIFVLCELLR